jgi:uncharacterized protein (UPF0210 family)
MIRSLTIGLPLHSASPAVIDSGVRGFLKGALPRLDAQDLTPRTVRFTLPVVGEEGEIEGAIQSSLRWVDGLASDLDVRWMCLPLDFVSDGNRAGRLATALDAIGRFPRLFLNLIVADGDDIAVDSVNDVADLILKISRKSNNGFDNFRVGASCNCMPNSPFFPYSRHEGDDLAFSFALETTEIALRALTEEPELWDIEDSRDRLVSALVPYLRNAQAAGDELAQRTGIEFRGVDASFAPLPNGRMSVGALVERMLGAPVGSHGSVLTTAILTDALRAALQQSGARPVGFNGVMYSILEDERLAAATSRRQINLDSLVSLAAVCGCGLDMVPVPGTSFKEEIAVVILDIAALSATLKKPLGVRLLPIPNRAANEFTEFNLDFLCDSRVMGLTANDRQIKLRSHLFQLLSPLKE